MSAYNYIATFNEWNYSAKKIDYDAPVEKWEHQKNNVEHLSIQLDGRKLWAQTSFTKEDVELLKDVLLEVFWRGLPHTFSKVINILCYQDGGFTHSALLEASRQGQQDLLKHTLTIAAEHNYISDMIASSLIGNQLSTALWLVARSGQQFGMSQTDLKDLVKKSQIQRQKIFAICHEFGDVNQIFHNIESMRYDGVKSTLISDWNAAKQAYIQSHREEPLVVRLRRKM